MVKMTAQQFAREQQIRRIQQQQQNRFADSIVSDNANQIIQSEGTRLAAMLI